MQVRAAQPVVHVTEKEQTLAALCISGLLGVGCIFRHSQNRKMTPSLSRFASYPIFKRLSSITLQTKGPKLTLKGSHLDKSLKKRMELAD